MLITRAEPAEAAALAAGVEDEGADCAVPALPDAGSLPTNAKLPDPFTKLDGTRITSHVRLALPPRGDQEAGREVRLRREARQAAERHRARSPAPTSP